MIAASTLAVAAIVAVGAALQGSVGIGFTVLAAPLLVMLAPELVPGPILLLGVLIAGMTTTREFRSVDVRQLGLAMSGRIAGTIAAGTVIALLPPTAFGFIFAVMILAAIALSLLKWHVLPTPRNLVTAGMVSGFMGTITSVGSPPMGLVYQNMPGPKVRATVSAFFLLGAGFSVITLATVGRFTSAQAAATLWLVPPVLLGFVASRYLVRHVDKSKRGVKTAVLAISGFAAVVLLVRPWL